VCVEIACQSKVFAKRSFPVLRVPVADIFQTGKRRKKRENAFLGNPEEVSAAVIMGQDSLEGVVSTVAPNLVGPSRTGRRNLFDSLESVQDVFDSESKDALEDALSSEEETADPWGDYYDDYAEDFKDQVETVPSNTTSLQPGQSPAEVVESLPPEIYCDLINTLEDQCLSTSILELWSFNEDKIASLAKDDILNAINNVKVR